MCVHPDKHVHTSTSHRREISHIITTHGYTPCTNPTQMHTTWAEHTTNIQGTHIMHAHTGDMECKMWLTSYMYRGIKCSNSPTAGLYTRDMEKSLSSMCTDTHIHRHTGTLLHAVCTVHRNWAAFSGPQDFLSVRPYMNQILGLIPGVQEGTG